MSPSSKLRSVGLVPAVWGKMVLTRDFLLRLRPDDCDIERDMVNSLMLPWSADEIGITETKTTHILSPYVLEIIFRGLFVLSETHLWCKSHWCVSFQPSVPELRSVEVVSAGRGSGLNMLASGLICAFRGGAGGGTRESWFLMKYMKSRQRGWARSEMTVCTDRFMSDSSKTQAWPTMPQLVRSTGSHRQC